ncbi:MAG: hypothetical protein ACYTBJ_00630 [Planctomycetota bacterium]
MKKLLIGMFLIVIIGSFVVGNSLKGQLDNRNNKTIELIKKLEK